MVGIRKQCGATYPADLEVTCVRPVGHRGDHRQAYHQGAARWPNTAVPQRCGQRLINVPSQGDEQVCALPDEHRSEFHRTESGATWSTAGDFQPAPSLQHDACGARLTLTHPTAEPLTFVCALGPHDSNEHHRAAYGTQWRATDFPPTAPTGEHVMCAHEVSELRKQVAERGEMIAKLRNALARSGPCCCPEHVYATIDGAVDGDREMDPLCPKHGTVAELARQLAWAHSFTARIMAALPEEWSEPFHGGDAAAEIVRRMDEFASIDAVRAVLREAGLGYAPPADDVHDLAHQRDCAQEHAKNAEDALTRIADMARQALGTVGSGTPHPLITFQQAMGRIVTECERGDR